MADLGMRYATALFELSQENGLVNEFMEQASFLRENLMSQEALALLNHPRISAERKNAFLEDAFKQHVHPDLLHFMKLAIAKNRESFIIPALTALIDMIKVYNRQTTARVVSAVPLSDEQAGRLAALLSRKLGKTVDVYVLVDPRVIAGISIHVDGYFVDQTARTLMGKMKDDLLRA